VIPAAALGIFLVARSGSAQAPATIFAVSDPATAGVSEYVQWAQIEATDGVPDYSLVEVYTPAILDAGRPVIVTLMAGGFTPPWMASYGVPNATFVNSLPTGLGTYECQTSTEYTPWNATFQARYVSALTNLVLHLQGEGVNVVGVGFSGINHLTAEFHAESQTKVAAGSGCAGTNATALWEGLGYTSTLMESAAASIYESVAEAFPSMAYSFPFTTSNELPLIGPKGTKVGAAKVTGYLDTVIANAVDEGAATQWNGLVSGVTLPSQWQSGGVLQTNPWFVGQAGNPCSPADAPVTCTDAVYGAELEGAVSAGAGRIEVWAGAYSLYEDQIYAANQALLGR